MRLFSIIKRAARKHPDKIALIDADFEKSYSYRELYAHSLSLARHFKELGVGRGQKVTLHMANSFELFSSLFSLLLLDAVPVLADHASTVRELSEQMQLVDSATLIGDSAIDYGERLEQQCRVIITPAGLPDFVFENGEAVEPTNLESEVIFFSYRDMGRALPVLFSERALIYSILNNIYLTEVNSTLRISLLLPISHIFAFTCGLLTPLFVGGTVIVNNNSIPRRLLKLYNRYEVNFFLTVPALLKLFLHAIRRANVKPLTLKRGIVGGDYCPPELTAEWREQTGAQLVSGYGLTECCPVISNSWRADRPASIGRPMYGVEVKVLAASGEECSVGVTGRLFIKGRTMMKGYYGMADLTSELLVDGWFDTGDLAYIDSEGYLYFAGREKGIAKIGGITVDLSEVKKVLESHEEIDRAELKIEHDQLWGDKITCYLKGRREFDKIELYDYCKDYLAVHKIPKSVVNL